MSEKSEKAKELFKSGYNCSQSVLGVFSEELGLDLKTALKISSSFGGGMGRMREVCGTVSAMFMVIGLFFSDAENSVKSKTEQYKRVQELAGRFKERNGSIICRELLNGIEVSNCPVPSERTTEYYKKRPCVKLVIDAVQLCEAYIKEVSKEKQP